MLDVTRNALNILNEDQSSGPEARSDQNDLNSTNEPVWMRKFAWVFDNKFRKRYLINRISGSELPKSRQLLREDKARLACYFKIALYQGELSKEAKAFIDDRIPDYFISTEEGISIYRALISQVSNSIATLLEYINEYCSVSYQNVYETSDLINELTVLSVMNVFSLAEKGREIKDVRNKLDLPIDKYEDLIETILRECILEDPKWIFGSGFIIEKSGFIITNHHVIERASSVFIRSNNNLDKARIIIADSELDLALLKIDSSLPALPFQESAAKLSQTVFALGFPNPKEYGLAVSATEGTINSLTGHHDKMNHYQISTLVDKGFSGGPLIDEKGGGIVGVLVQQYAANVKCAYAIKADALLQFLGRYPDLLNSIKYCSFRWASREALIEQACQSVVQVLAYY